MSAQHISIKMGTMKSEYTQEKAPMFAVEAARIHAVPPEETFDDVLKSIYVESIRDLMESTNRQIFGEIKPRPRQTLTGNCDKQGMLSRLHLWDEPTRVPTKLCYQCDGTKKYYDEEGYGEQNCEACNEWGYVEGYSYRYCDRCRKYESTRDRG